LVGSGIASCIAQRKCFVSLRLIQTKLKPLRTLLFVSVAALALSACASNPMTTGSIGGDQVGQPMDRKQQALAQLAAHYKKSPGDRATIIYYAAALRANGQNDQAVAVLESGVAKFRNDPEMLVGYAKALAAAGRFEQALNVADRAISPTSPDWNALMVKGAILDQSGRNQEARAAYGQALKIAPGVTACQSRPLLLDDQRAGQSRGRAEDRRETARRQQPDPAESGARGWLAGAVR
jgi:tetratricopeptide (TPR) repeat protein